MRITSLKIGCRRYAVEGWDGTAATDDEARGDHSYRLGRIRISDDYATGAQAETLIHEVLHAIIADMGIEWSEKDEERLVEQMSPRIAAFLADNPEQVRELLRMLK